jgi:hypothetical protein
MDAINTPEIKTNHHDNDITTYLARQQNQTPIFIPIIAYLSNLQHPAFAAYSKT